MAGRRLRAAEERDYDEQVGRDGEGDYCNISKPNLVGGWLNIWRLDWCHIRSRLRRNISIIFLTFGKTSMLILGLWGHWEGLCQNDLMVADGWLRLVVSWSGRVVRGRGGGGGVAGYKWILEEVVLKYGSTADMILQRSPISWSTVNIVLVVTGAKVLIEEGPVPVIEYCIMSMMLLMIKIYLRNVNCCVFLQILPAVICVLFSVRMAEVVDLKFGAKLSFHKEFC